MISRVCSYVIVKIFLDSNRYPESVIKKFNSFLISENIFRFKSMYRVRSCITFEKESRREGKVRFTWIYRVYSYVIVKFFLDSNIYPESVIKESVLM